MKRHTSLVLIAGWLFSGGVNSASGQLATAGCQPPPDYIAGQQGPSGSIGRCYCSTTHATDPTSKLVSINVSSASWIDRIELGYDTGGPGPVFVHCGGTGGHPNRPLLLGRGEFIVRVKGRYGNYIDYLYVQTDGPQGMKFRDFGNPKSTAPGQFDYIAPAGTAIADFYIRAETYIDAVGVILRKRP
jgi:hypothetical protein